MFNETLEITPPMNSKTHRYPRTKTHSFSQFFKKIAPVPFLLAGACAATLPAGNNAGADASGPPAAAESLPAGLAGNPFPFPFTARNEIYKDGWVDFNKNGKKDIYEDASAPVETRLDDLMSQMNIDEKIVQLVTLYGFPHVLKDKHPLATWKNEIWKDGIANIDQHGDAFGNGRGDMNDTPERNAFYLNNTQRFFVEQTRLGIPVDFTNEGIRGACIRNAASFPSPNGMGATWDVALALESGRIAGEEARAVGYTNIYGPILDVVRDQRWGRWEGTFAEDPFLVAELGKAVTLGIQENGHVAASPKHYVGYGENKGARGWDSRTDPHITAQTFEAIHFYPWKRVFQEAHPLGVMCAYNDINGVPVAGSKHLLTERLRGELGFKGYVVSDSGAVERLHNSHRVAKDLKDAHRIRIESGLNVWTTFVQPAQVVKWIHELYDEKRLSEKTIDTAARDVLRVKFLVGLFDYPYVKNPAAANGIVGCEKFQAIALRASRECLVLLKNENSALPLDASKLKKIAVIGPNADKCNYVPTHYGPSGFKFVSVFEGLKNQLAGTGAEIAYEEGCKIAGANWPDIEIIPEEMTDDEKAGIAKAVELAKKSDVAVVVLGDHAWRTSGESRTRNSLNLPGRQQELLSAVYAAGKPVVLVLIHGRPTSINWAQKYVPAILSASYPGAQGGTAIAEALLGKYNPGGKLNGTWPKTVGQIPMNFPAKPKSNDEPNTKTRAHIAGALYPFGYGLSYTTFKYENPSVTPLDGGPENGFRVSVDLTNTGSVAGDEVVQLYVSYTEAPVNWFDEMLRGFKRVHLAPGETKTVTLDLPASHLEIALDAEKWIRPTTPFEIRLGTSSEDLKYRILIQDGKVIKVDDKPVKKNAGTLNPLTA